MPPLFQACCDRCSLTSDVFPEEYGAVFVKEPLTEPFNAVVAGAVLWSGSATDAPLAEQNDPRLVVLAHPLEQEILNQIGSTWTGLAWSGRYVRMRRVVCPSCGTVFEIRMLACPPGFGCVVGPILGTVAGTALGLWERSIRWGCGVGYGAAVGCWAAARLVGWVYLRLRFRERARALAGANCCPRCGGRKYGSVNSRRAFPCPRCGARAMRVRPVGWS